MNRSSGGSGGQFAVDGSLSGVHWSPGGALPVPPPSAAGAVLSAAEEDDEATAAPMEAASSLRGPTVVIWHRPDCGACRLSEPLFRALEQNAFPMFVEVRRRVATRAALRRYPAHLTSLPLYDFVWPDSGPPPPALARPAPRGGPHPYGPAAAVESVRNNDVARIRQLVPALAEP